MNLPLLREAGKVAPKGVERRPSLDGLWRRMRCGAQESVGEKFCGNGRVAQLLDRKPQHRRFAPVFAIQF